MPDLSRFVADNEKYKGKKRRVPWDERLAMVQEEFPSVVDVDWHDVLKNEDVFIRLMRDFLQVDQIEPGRKGQRPQLDEARGRQTITEMLGRGFSEHPFVDAFRHLTAGESLTTIARKTAISRSRVHRLQQGAEDPTIEDLRIIAEAYGRKPAYFREYRCEYILAAVMYRLSSDPDMVTPLYSKIVKLR